MHIEVYKMTAESDALTITLEAIGDIIAVGQLGENIFYALYSNGKPLLI